MRSGPLQQVVGGHRVHDRLERTSHSAARRLAAPGTWRPFVLGRCRHRPHATYPDGGQETALRVAPRPSLFGLAPGGVCHAAPVASRAVGSYPTLSPLPRLNPTFARRNHGGLLSVALSLGSPPPAINRHRVSMEPGLSSPAAFRLLRVRPPGQLAGRIKAFAARKRNRKSRPCSRSLEALVYSARHLHA